MTKIKAKVSKPYKKFKKMYSNFDDLTNEFLGNLNWNLRVFN